jgi:hypothetical protein
MKAKVSEASGPALDWMVAKCEGLDLEFGLEEGENFSSNWGMAGPIIEREEIGIKRRMPCMRGEEWEAHGSISAKGAGYRWAAGPTPLVAAMRCYVASKLGEEVEVPDELA